MKSTRVLALLLFFALCSTSTLRAVDDGQTRPKLDSGAVSTGTVTVVYSTGSGNVKGVSCLLPNVSIVNVKIYVNGGTAQTLSLSDGYYPVDTNGAHFTGFVPMNVRFSSSIQVDIQKASSPVNNYEATCVVSWALD